MKKNKVVKVLTYGGWVSLALPASQRIRAAIEQENVTGWTVRQIMPNPASAIMYFIYGLILALTLFIWCPSRGYLIIFEKEVSGDAEAEKAAPAAIKEAAICSSCKVPLDDGVKFCKNCGEKTEKTESIF